MNKRSMTLLETLIALVLVLALGALIFPSFINSMDERTFESAADVTNEQLMMARAHAQATGSPVEVTYQADSSQVQARLFTPWLPGFQPTASRSAAAAPGDDRRNLGPLGPVNDDTLTPDRGLIGEPWACRDVGRGVRFLAHRPSATNEHNSPFAATSGAAPDNGRSDSDSFQELRKGQEIRLAVFMPDGSALMGEPVWLNDDKGRCGLLTINPWSGLPMFQRLSDVSDDLGNVGNGQFNGGGESPKSEASHPALARSHDADHNGGAATGKSKAKAADDEDDSVGSQ